MKTTGVCKKISIYIGASDQWHGQPLYNAIVQRAKSEGLGGATVFQGIEGYGAHSKVHRASILDISTNLPIVVEIVDCGDEIDRFLPILDEMVEEGLITVQECEVVKYISRSRQN